MQKRFSPNLFATCVRYRNLVSPKVRKWFGQQPNDVWPTNLIHIHNLLLHAGNDSKVYHERKVARFVTVAFESGQVDAAVWILTFGVGIQGPHHHFAPPELHGWLSAIGCKKWPRPRSVVCVDSLSMGIVLSICSYTHQACVKPLGNTPACWMDVLALNVTQAVPIHRQAARRGSSLMALSRWAGPLDAQ